MNLYLAPAVDLVKKRGKHKIHPRVLKTSQQIIREAVATALLKPRFEEWRVTTGDVVEISNDVFNYFGSLGLKVMQE